MEKVVVLRNVRGLLKKGDILVSEGFGKNFKMEYAKENKEFTETKRVEVDYFSVCENIPVLFDFTIDEEEYESLEDYLFKTNYKVVRSEEEIKERALYYKEQAILAETSGEAKGAKEAMIVYNNLLWLIDWLTGKTELI